MRLYLFAPIPYHFLHQRPQKIADHLRELSIPVTYIEPNGFREYVSGPRKGFLKSLCTSLGYHALALLSFVYPPLRKKPTGGAARKSRPEGMEKVLLPLVLPTNRINSPILERFNAAVIRQAIRRLVFRNMPSGEETVAFVENPFYGQVLARGDFSKVFYDCLDEISLYAGLNSPQRYLEYELKLIGLSNAVFVTAGKLEEHLRSIPQSPPVYRIPNGVDYEWFREQAARADVPEDLLGIPRPIVGYVGAIYNWLDYDLIGTMARNLPDVSFVFVGPADTSSRGTFFTRYGNLHFLGRKAYEAIPAYIKQFAVCLIPFVEGKISQTTNPVKVFEYFALGKPVVTTGLYELNHYRDRGLLLMPDNGPGFVTAIRKALADTDEQLRILRMQVARENSWQSHVSKMKSILCQ